MRKNNEIDDVAGVNGNKIIDIQFFIFQNLHFYFFFVNAFLLSQNVAELLSDIHAD